MPRFAFLLNFLCVAPLFAQQHDHRESTATAPRLTWGAQGIGLLTHATPAVGTTQSDGSITSESRTESYFTQPNLFAHADWRALSVMATLNFEGRTLRNGELNAGTWGEGFYDKRHPHTYVHELMAVAAARFSGTTVSLSAGKGFASFGSDDPMVRPLVKFPANHHLGQILERLVVIGAARRGPVLVEASAFNGDEPANSRSMGTLDRVGDSWAARLTLFPRAGYEVQASYALVNSPERSDGGGWDQHKWSAAVRHERELGNFPHYFLIEYLRTGEVADGEELFSLDSWLAEGWVAHRKWKAAGRIEWTLRPEEERAGSMFRSPWPHIDEHVFGLTRWFIVSANLSHAFKAGPLRLEPLLEVSHQRPTPDTRPAIFEPEQMYGSDKLWSFSLGVRIEAGASHKRMGRYGVALTETHLH